MTVAILQIKLGASMLMPSRTFYRLLSQTAKDCNIARNAMLRHWQRWREDNPDWAPEQRRNRDGSLKARKDGTPVLENACISQVVGNELYSRGTGTVPNVAATIISSLSQAVQGTLRAKVPWNFECESQYRWQAIMAYEISAPTYRAMSIPVPNNSSVLCYEGETSRDLSAGVDATVRTCGQSSCVMRFPLLSRRSGWAQNAPIVRLDVRKMSRGHRKLLRGIATREIKLADSELVLKKDKWFLMLCYHLPEVESTLDVARTPVLYPSAPGERRPFVLILPSGHRFYLGDGVPFAAEHKRLLIRRKVMRSRYKDGCGAGHGQSGFYRRLRPYSRAFRDLEDRITKQLVSDIVKTCERNDCGSLLYREPTMPLRTLGWFGDRGIPFDWTSFAGRLQFKLAQRGVKQDKTRRVGVAEHREMFGWGKKKEAG